MKIELYAKKINKGHISIGTVDVPENFGYEYRLPVKQHLEVKSSEIPSFLGENFRIFRYTPSPLTHGLKIMRMYLEI